MGRSSPTKHSLILPEASMAHLYVARGPVHLENAGVLQTGDAVRLTGAGSRRIVNSEGENAEILMWAFQE